MSYVCRIYATTTGQCLARNTTDIDEAERTRVQQDFHTGVKLAVDTRHDEVRGIVPIRRRDEETFIARVGGGITSDPDPLEKYATSVTTLIEEQSGWQIRRGVPAGALHNQLTESPRSVLKVGDMELVADAVRNSDEGIVTVRVPSLASAAATCRQLLAPEPAGTDADRGEGISSGLVVSTTRSARNRVGSGGLLVRIDPEVDGTTVDIGGEPSDSRASTDDRSKSVFRSLLDTIRRR